jgi:methyltransferase
MVTASYWIFFALLAAQRLTEVWISKINTSWMRRHGGREFGAGNLKIVVGVFVVFFAGIPAETMLRKTNVVPYWPVLFSVFLLAQGLRYWAMGSLGRFWNIRVWVIPGEKRVVRGPYRWMRHPNYLAVTIEMIVVPWMVQAFWVGGACLAGYLYFLRRRLEDEEAALRTLATPFDIH